MLPSAGVRGRGLPAAQGDKFVRRSTPHYLYLTRAMLLRPRRRYGSLRNAFAACTASFLVVSFRSDWLFPPVAVAGHRAALRGAATTWRTPTSSATRGTNAFCSPATASAICSPGFSPAAREGPGRDRTDRRAAAPSIGADARPRPRARTEIVSLVRRRARARLGCGGATCCCGLRTEKRIN